MMTMLLKLLLFVALHLRTRHCIEIRVASDVRSVSGSQAEVVCEVNDLNDPLEDCEFYSPDRQRVRSNDTDLRVRTDGRRDECILRIDRLDSRHSGAWECVAYEGRSEAAKYAFVRVYDKSGSFQTLLDDNEKSLTVSTGEQVKLLCPTNHAAGSNVNNRAMCTWTSPTGKRYTMVGRYGEMYDYSAEGISQISEAEINSGNCGIVLDRAQLKQDGEWTCSVVRKQKPGSTSIGSEVTNTKIDLNVAFRRSRVSAELTLQGARRGDRGFVEVDVEIDDDEEFTDFFWILRRELKLYEGEEECIRGDCYIAERRFRNRGKGSTWYTLELEIERVEYEDLDDPIALIKDYRAFNSVDDLQKVYFVTATPEDYDYDDYNYDNNDNNNRNNRNNNRNNRDRDRGNDRNNRDRDNDRNNRNNRDRNNRNRDSNPRRRNRGGDLLDNGDEVRDRRFISEKLLQFPDNNNNDNEGNSATDSYEFVDERPGCYIRNEFVPVGGKIDYPEFCISIRCIFENEVDARSMDESKCRRRRRGKSRTRS